MGESGQSNVSSYRRRGRLAAWVGLVAALLIFHQEITLMAGTFLAGRDSVAALKAYQRRDYYQVVERLQRASQRPLASEEIRHLLEGAILADALDKTGQWEQAEQVYRQALQRQPQDPELLNNLGYFYAQRGIKLDEAIRLIQRALVLRPAAGYIMDSLGWAYYKKGWLERAEEELLKAVRLERNPEIWRHLAIVQWERGQRSAARLSLEQAFRLDPDDPETDRLRQRLSAPP